MTVRLAIVGEVGEGKGGSVVGSALAPWNVGHLGRRAAACGRSGQRCGVARAPRAMFACSNSAFFAKQRLPVVLGLTWMSSARLRRKARQPSDEQTRGVTSVWGVSLCVLASFRC